MLSGQMNTNNGDKKLKKMSGINNCYDDSLLNTDYYSPECFKQRNSHGLGRGLNAPSLFGSSTPSGSGTPPVSNNGNGNGKKGFDFGALFSGLTKGLGGTTLGKEVVSVKNEGKPNEVVTVTPLPSRGWIPFAIIGGVAVAGVIAYVAIKNRNK